MLLIERSLIRLMPRHLDKIAIYKFRIKKFLQVDLRIIKAFRRSYTTLAFWGIATRISYKVHRAPVHFHSHHDIWIPKPFYEHMDLKQALLHAEQFQLRLLAQRTANFVDVSMEMIIGFWWQSWKETW